MVSRLLSKFMIFLFVFACFIALYYEPAFLYFSNCGWSGMALGADGPCGQSWIGRAWLGYLQIEPIYANAPRWIQLVNEFDVFLFGWFYLLSVFVFLMKKEDQTWYRNLATFIAGMMTYSMILYLTWQILSVEETKANLQSVIIANGLWLFIFTMLMTRLYLFPGANARATAHSQ
ncbi:MAG TPA: hypothetical protein VLC91_16640 [Spongiibacteraceae bacterium]|nr:hypothetical protein [Spongiibacteraceae bacterium]